MNSSDELKVSISYFPKHVVDLMRSAFKSKIVPPNPIETVPLNKPLEPEKRDYALRAAAENGDLPWTTRLLNQGANPNAADAMKFTALMAAAMNGHTEIAKILIEKGADVEAKSCGKTALILAAEAGHVDIVELLRKAMKK